MGFFSGFWSWTQRILLPAKMRPLAVQYRIGGVVQKQLEAAERAALGAGQAIDEIAPPAPPRPSALSRFLVWTLHFLLVAAILVGLYYLNAALSLEQVLRSPFPSLHGYWLPLLFLLLYGMAWLGWWLWELTGPDKLAGDFPDVDRAFFEALHAVAGAGVELREVPLFLVLGRPQAAEEAVFQASGMALRPTPPRRLNAPLHAYVTADAVFLTCTGASLLGRLTDLLAEETAPRPGANGAVRVEPPATEPPPPPGEALAVIPPPAPEPAPPVPGQEQAVAGGPDALTEEQRRVVGILSAEEEVGKRRPDDKRRALLRNTPVVEELAARLRHLCRLVVRYRRPYCPINGVLVLLPLAALEDDREASQAATACAQDLEVAHDELRVQAPVLTLVCDLNRAAGFREFLARLPGGQRHRRLGQRFPLVPDVDDSAVPEVVQQGVGWLCRTVLPSLVYNLFRAEGAAAEAVEATDGNIRLYRFLEGMRGRRQRLGRFLTRGLRLDVPGTSLFGGVYLAGTGGEEERAFVAGVFQKLVENQNHVSWTREALAAEASYRRWARAGCLGVVLLVAAGLALTWILWRW